MRHMIGNEIIDNTIIEITYTPILTIVVGVLAMVIVTIFSSIITYRSIKEKTACNQALEQKRNECQKIQKKLQNKNKETQQIIEDIQKECKIELKAKAQQIIKDLELKTIEYEKSLQNEKNEKEATVNELQIKIEQCQKLQQQLQQMQQQKINQDKKWEANQESTQNLEQKNKEYQQQLNQTEQAVQDLRQKHNEFIKDLRAKIGDIQKECETELEAKQQIIDDFELKINGDQKAQKQLKHEQQSCITDLKQKCSELEQNVDEKEQTITDLELKIKEHEKVQKQLKQEKQNCIQDFEQKQSDQELLQKQMHQKANAKQQDLEEKIIEYEKGLQNEKSENQAVMNELQIKNDQHEKLQQQLQQQKTNQDKKWEANQANMRNLAQKNKECQQQLNQTEQAAKDLKQKHNTLLQQFNKQNQFIQDLQEQHQCNINKCIKMQVNLTDQCNQHRYDISRLQNIEKNVFLTLTKHLTLAKNEKYRWLKYEQKDDEKDEKNINGNTLECVIIIKENPIWVKLIADGNVKKIVCPDSLLLAPIIGNHNIHRINEYHEQLFKLNALKSCFGEWKVVAASHAMDKAKILSSKQQDTPALWSGCSDFPQWFVIDTNIPTFITSLKWRTYYNDAYSIKQFKLQISNQSHEYDHDSNSWIDVQSYTSAQSHEWQERHILKSRYEKISQSRYWRFYVESSHGGYPRLSQLKLTFDDI